MTIAIAYPSLYASVYLIDVIAKQKFHIVKIKENVYKIVILLTYKALLNTDNYIFVD